MAIMHASQPTPMDSDAPDLVITRVHEDLAALVFPRNVCDDLLEFLVAIEVRKLWLRPIKTFIPVLALRAARERLDAFYALQQVTFSGIDAAPLAAPAPSGRPPCVGGIDRS